MRTHPARLGGNKVCLQRRFYKKINTLHLDFTAREALNTDARENHSLSEPVVVRIYQLKDRQTFDRLVYQQLLEEGDILLAADLLASRDVVIGPGGDASLNMPLEAEATFVAVVGLFRHPDTQRNTWKQVLAREELDPDKPRIFTAEHNQLRLRPEAASNVKNKHLRRGHRASSPSTFVTSERAITIFIQPNRFHHSTGR